MFLKLPVRPCFAKVSFSSLVALCAFAAQAADVTEDIVLNESTNVVVAAGETETWSGLVSGEGSVVKQGDGTLVFAHAENTFSGGVTIQAGGIEATASGAFGTGRLEATGSAAKIVFNADKGSFPNDIHYAVGHTGTDLAPEGFFVFLKDTEIHGDVTSVGSIQISPLRTTTDPKTTYGPVVDFYGKVTPVGNVYMTTYGQISFHQAVGNETGSEFSIGPFWSCGGVVRLYSPDNPLGVIPFYSEVVECQAVNSIYKATLQWNYRTIGTNPYGYALDSVYLNGFDQRITALYTKSTAQSSRTDTTGQCLVTPADKPATLTILGRSVEASCTARLEGPLTLVLDAAAYPDFVQTFDVRESLSTGPIIVSNGTMKVAGTATFSHVPSLEVAGGTFEFAGTQAGGLSGLTKLTVRKGATFRVADGAEMPITEWAVELDIASDATFDSPKGKSLRLKSLTVDGERKPDGTYTGLPCFGDGVKVLVQSVVGGSLCWKNATGDGQMSTLGNWDPVPETIDFKSGMLGIRIDAQATANGEDMVYGDDTHVGSITNETYFEFGADKTVHPLVIRPATPGGTLVMHRGLYSYNMGQIVLSGHIALPDGEIATTAAAADPRTFYYRFTHTDKFSNVPAGMIDSSEHSSNAYSPCLVLSNATVDVGLCTYHESTQANIILGYRGTTNVVNGYYNISGWQGAINSDVNASLTFRGGAAASNTQRLVGPGEICFAEKPIDTIGTFVEKGCKLVLDAVGCKFTGNTAREGLGITKGSIEFRRSSCFNTGDQQLYFNGNDPQAIEMNQTTQLVGIACFASTGNNPHTLHGDYPAMLEVTGKVRSGATASYVQKLACGVPVNGGLGFHVCAESADVVFPLFDQAFQSCGDLEVSGGTLELKANASWRNGTNFVARGTGTLKFDGSRQVDNRFAVLKLEDDGKVEVADGKVLAVAECRVGGTKVETGVYAAADLKEGDALYGHLTSGTLRVGRIGKVLLVR